MATTGNMLFISVDELEDRFGSGKTENLARESEYAFLKKVTDIAYEAAWNREMKAIFISGPTSSGKTTFANRLGSAIHLYGRPTLRISLDDYYITGQYAVDENGRPDMESISTLDTDLMVENFRDLLDGKEANIPLFDFKTRTRTYPPEHKVKLENNAIMIVEGLHGLAEEVIGQLPARNVLGVFICPWATLMGDRALLQPQNIRQMRRICRDYHHRGTGALATLDYWPMIERSEEASVRDYLARADYFINSVIPYEFFVISPMAARYLEADLARIEQGKEVINNVTPDGKFIDLPRAVQSARDLIRVNTQLPGMSAEIVPPMSILNEFIQ